MDTPPAPRRRRLVLSVRTRIVAAITVVAALGLIVVGLTVYIAERNRTIDAIEDRLADNLASARFIIAEGDPETGTWTTADAALYAVVQRMSPDDNTGALGIIEGRAVMEPGAALDLDLQSASGFVDHVAGQVTGASPIIGTYAEDGVAWRYLAAPISVAGGDAAEQVLFAMAYDIEAELAEINDAARAYLIAASLALAVIALVATLVSTHLLRPLRRMRDTAERVSAQSLSERLPVPGRDDVSELAATMNDMLDRLDGALDSQRQLLSDVGHELKTPITIVRGQLEVMDATDPDDVRDTQTLVVDELERMAGLVQDLAAAAALHGPSPVSPVQVDAGELVQQIGRKARSIEGANVTIGAVAEVVAALDPARITQAALQLVQNAVTHGGGTIDIGSRVHGGALEVWVRDHGPGVSEAEKPLVFDRFHRGDQERGSGLGLNIVQVIARAHGGSVRVDDAEGGGARFVMALPLASSTLTLPSGLVIPPKPPLPAPTLVDAGRGL